MTLGLPIGFPVEVGNHLDRGFGGSVGIVSTFPPTSCGLATFASALSRGLREAGVSEIGTVRCIGDSDTPMGIDDGMVWNPSPEGPLEDLVRYLNRHDVVFLQHEYGIYGPQDGVAVLNLIDQLDAPVIPTLHTVPSAPSDSQTRILESVVARSTATVVMTEAARSRLIHNFNVDASKVHNIPHGATRPPNVAADGQGGGYALTWGLLGPGKGIEWVVDALATVPLRNDDLEYRVVGRTHPKVMARDGTAYVDMLKKRAADLGIGHKITFDDHYHSLESLLHVVAGASLVILPYDSEDQITSGVLVDAITAGVPVMATRFPHAEELLGDGAGMVVPHRDPSALAEAIHSFVSDADLRESMRTRAREHAERHDWKTVAQDYLRLARRTWILQSPDVPWEGRVAM